jgi:hypothetical protein
LKVFGAKRGEVTGRLRKLYNEELHNMYSSVNIVRVIKSRMRWFGHRACMGEMRTACKIFVRKSQGREDWMIILKCIFENWNVKVGTGL